MSSMYSPAEIKALNRQAQARTLAAHLDALRTMGATDPTQAVVTLRRLERLGQRVMENYCNLPDMDKAVAAYKSLVIRSLTPIFGALPAGLIINRDPRGYILKIDGEKCPDCPLPVKDWGGYFILAPEGV